MAAQLSQSSFFTEKKLIQHNIGSDTIMVYPRLTSDMSLAEKAHAFHINKNALENINLTTRQSLKQLGDSLGCSAVVTFTAGNFEKLARSQLRSGIVASATTYHKRNGFLIKDTVDAANDNELKPIKDDLQKKENLRSDGICFARLTCHINFKQLDPSNTQDYKYSYFHILPTESREVFLKKNVNSSKFLLAETFTGPADWATSTRSRNISAYWDHPTAMKVPFDLAESSIKDKASDAEMNLASAKNRLDNIIYQAAENHIKKAIFEHICPNYVDDPAAAILKIKQVTVDDIDSSKTITLSVSQYHDRILSLMEQLGSSKDYSIDVAQHFYQNLSPKIKEKVKLDGYQGDSKINSRGPFDQFQLIKDLLFRATSAEAHLEREKHSIQEIMNSHHSFISVPLTVNNSTAEKTIKSYKDPQGAVCWGCGGNHAWYSTTLKQVTCPKADDPAVQANAAIKFKEYKQRKKERYENYKKKKKIESILSDVIDKNKDLDENELKVKFQEVLASRSSSESPTKKQRYFSAESTVTLFFEVMSSYHDGKPLLDIPVQKHLPHFSFHIGPVKHHFHPQLQPAYDTCAALNCGYMPYHLSIAKAYPDLVKSLIYAGDDYSPLILRGVVSDSDKAIDNTTALTAVIEYYTPYTTVDGSNTTLKVALGNHVSANLILGMSTIKAARLTLDMNDDIVASSILDNFPPSKVVYKNTQRGLPNNVPKDNDADLSFKIEQTIKHASIVDQVKKNALENIHIASNVSEIAKNSADSTALIPVASNSNDKVHETALITVPKEDNNKTVKFTLIDQEASKIYFA